MDSFGFSSTDLDFEQEYGLDLYFNQDDDFDCHSFLEKKYMSIELRLFSTTRNITLSTGSKIFSASLEDCKNIAKMCYDHNTDCYNSIASASLCIEYCEYETFAVRKTEDITFRNLRQETEESIYSKIHYCLTKIAKKMDFIQKRKEKRNEAKKEVKKEVKKETDKEYQVVEENGKLIYHIY